MKMNTRLQKIHVLLMSNKSHVTDMYLLMSLLAYVCYRGDWKVTTLIL